MSGPPSNPSLSYYVCFPNQHEVKSFRYSLRIEDSDIFENQNLLNSIVGTLVKYSNSGKIEPYLAEKWWIDNYGKKWTFLFRKGLTDSDGKAITARRYASQLKPQLKFLKERLGALLFDKLIGWDDFVSGVDDNLDGLIATDDSISFEFKEPVVNLLEFLRMAYFGMWPEKPIDGLNHEEFYKFTSTGSFIIEPNSLPNSLTLRARNNWFASNNGSFKTVYMKVCDVNTLPDSEFTLIRGGTSLGAVASADNFLTTVTAPTLLTAAIIAVEKPNSAFSNPQVRQHFANLLRLYIEKSIPADSPYYFARGFYAASTSPLEYPLSTENINPYPIAEVNVAIPGSINPALYKTLSSSIDKAAQKLGIRANFQTIDRSKRGWREQLTSNTFYDIRISSVDTGATFIKDAIEMMFCTKLGVSFPDPNGLICNLIKVITSNEISYDKANKQFENILERQAAVIPLYHSGILWLQSHDLSPITSSIGTNHPRFDTIQKKP